MAGIISSGWGFSLNDGSAWFHPHGAANPRFPVWRRAGGRALYSPGNFRELFSLFFGSGESDRSRAGRSRRFYSPADLTKPGTVLERLRGPQPQAADLISEELGKSIASREYSLSPARSRHQDRSACDKGNKLCRNVRQILLWCPNRVANTPNPTCCKAERTSDSGYHVCNSATSDRLHD